jgi:hypothetical protein
LIRTSNEASDCPTVGIALPATLSEVTENVEVIFDCAPELSTDCHCSPERDTRPPNNETEAIFVVAMDSRTLPFTMPEKAEL